MHGQTSHHVWIWSSFDIRSKKREPLDKFSELKWSILATCSVLIGCFCLDRKKYTRAQWACFRALAKVTQTTMASVRTPNSGGTSQLGWQSLALKGLTPSQTNIWMFRSTLASSWLFSFFHLKLWLTSKVALEKPIKSPILTIIGESLGSLKKDRKSWYAYSRIYLQRLQH